MIRPSLPARTRAGRLIAVVRGHDARQYPDLLSVMADAGLSSVELTMTTPGTLEALPRLVEDFGDRLDIAVGTVVDPSQIHQAHDNGASFVVTPVTRQDLLDTAAERSIPVVPGGLTPTELHAGWVSGAAAVKIFPASLVGSGYLKEIRGPFPVMQAIPSGGIDLHAAKDWLAAGADAVSVGGPLLGDALRGGSLSDLSERVTKFVSVCAE